MNDAVGVSHGGSAKWQEAWNPERLNCRVENCHVKKIEPKGGAEATLF